MNRGDLLIHADTHESYEYVQEFDKVKSIVTDRKGSAHVFHNEILLKDWDRIFIKQVVNKTIHKCTVTREWIRHTIYSLRVRRLLK